MLIGRPRFEIMILPISRKVAAVIASIERLKLNHVPQNTPVTSAKSITLTSCRIFIGRALQYTSVISRSRLRRLRRVAAPPIEWVSDSDLAVMSLTYA